MFHWDSECAKYNMYKPSEWIAVKPVLRDHCHEKPPVLMDHIFLAEGPTLQCTCS